MKMAVKNGPIALNQQMMTMNTDMSISMETISILTLKAIKFSMMLKQPKITTLSMTEHLGMSSLMIPGIMKRLILTLP